MKTPSLIAAAFVATATLGACSGTAPTGPQSKTTPASLELSNSTFGSSIGLDSTTVVQFCMVPLSTSDSSGLLSATGTYAVAYGSSGCTATP